jgi:hypothetical protein
MDLEHERRLAACEERAKSNSHRIDKLEESTYVLNQLAKNMGIMAEKQKQMVDSVEKLDGKVTALEQKPAKRWDSLISKIILTLTAAFLAYLLSKIGLEAPFHSSTFAPPTQRALSLWKYDPPKLCYVPQSYKLSHTSREGTPKAESMWEKYFV